MWPIGSCRYSHYSNYKAFGSLQMKIVVLMKEKEEKEKKKDNQYKLKKLIQAKKKLKS